MTTHALGLLVLLTASAAVPSAAPNRIEIVGRLKRYLDAPEGKTDGVVLQDGTVARFSARSVSQTARLQPGRLVRVEGLAVRGLGTRYLVHASVSDELANSRPPCPGAMAKNQSHNEDTLGLSQSTSAPEREPASGLTSKSARSRHAEKSLLSRIAAAMRKVTTGSVKAAAPK